MDSQRISLSEQTSLFACSFPSKNPLKQFHADDHVHVHFVLQRSNVVYLIGYYFHTKNLKPNNNKSDTLLVNKLIDCEQSLFLSDSERESGNREIGTARSLIS